MEYLETHPLEQDQRLIEVGCGWGLLGIFCAKQFAVDALLTDADEQVFAFVMTHAHLNQVSVRTEHVRFEGIAHRRLRKCDILLGADICFWPELGTQLRRLIERALCSGVQKILFADPGRASFMQLAKYCQHQFGATMIRQQAVTRAGSGGYVLVIEKDKGA
jgi:predicted nicotinamide N-methyase